jgi:uncharacterized membrane protein YraQ (UPF0718 family)
VPLALGLALLVALLVGAGRLAGADGVAELSTFTVIFASIVVEALPFVLLGALVSGLIEVFVSDRVFERVSRLPLRLQVPGLALCGVAMPVCECGSVPVARRLILHGVHPGAGIAFMLAAPILNPVVLFSTAVAYSGREAVTMVLARAGLGLVLATAAGADAFGLDVWVRVSGRVTGVGGAFEVVADRIDPTSPPSNPYSYGA